MTGPAVRASRQGELSPDSGRHLIALARAHVPGDAAIGVIHRDFCAENLVRDGAGPPHVIDNEAMQVGALDFDLARTFLLAVLVDASLCHLRKSTGRAADARGPLHALLDGSLGAGRWIPSR